MFEAAGAFDDITYQKGQAVVRMLEAYVGELAFRAGVRTYIKKYAYKNTVSDDFWAEIDAASSLPVSEIAHDFTLQAGVPLIWAEKAEGGLKLSQSRFAADELSPAPQAWRAPVAVRAAGGSSWRGIVHAGAATLLTGPYSSGAVVNAGRAGYFRTAYQPALWTSLAERFATLAPDDQLGLLHDSLALGEAGLAPLSDFLELAGTDAGADPVVLRVLGKKLADVDYYYEGLPGRPAYRAFARRRLNLVFARVAWDARPGETDNQGVLRGEILNTLGDLDDAAVIEEARRRFAAYLADPETLRGSTRRSVLDIVAGHANAETWDRFMGLRRPPRARPTTRASTACLVPATIRLLPKRRWRSHSAMSPRPPFGR